MSWTTLVNVPKMLTDDRQICQCFIHAAWSQAEREGKDFDIDPATYVADLFGGVLPTQEKLLELLESKGFNAGAIKREIYDDISALGEDQLKSKNEAQEFFNLFKTQWHVLRDDVEKLINENSIYFLLELAVTNAASTKARLLATKRHADNHKMKAKVFVWCDENMHRFSSMDDAALDIAETFVNQKFRAVRSWMTEWKKLRSAGTT